MPLWAPMIAMGQGLYYFVTGVWPLVHIRSFFWVTGPKRDAWLVKTVGVLVTVIGVVLFVAGYELRVSPEIALLGAGAAIGLAGIDVWYVGRRVILPIYLLDAVVELVILAVWAWAYLSGRTGR
jgi:hypothetical protein